MVDLNNQAVVNSKQAGKLAEAINSFDALKGQLKHLIVKFEPSNPGRGQRVAELLKAAPAREILVLHLEPNDQLGRSGEYGQLGKPMYEALQKLPHLVEVTLKDELQLAPNLFFRSVWVWGAPSHPHEADPLRSNRLLKSWPKLAHLRMPGVDL
jgi:hypothetical protein